MTEREKDSHRVYGGRIIDVDIETVCLPNGHQLELEVVQHPGGAAVLAVDESKRVCLLHQYRHVAGGWLWELPAGKIDAGETPLETAQRELSEEAGLMAGTWLSLGWIYTSPGVFKETIHLYLAQGLTTVATAHEPDELIEIRWLDMKEAMKWAQSGQIIDAKTLLGLYRARDLVDPDQ